MSRGNHVAGVNLEHVERETGTQTKVLAGARKLALVVVTAAQEELLVVGILGTYRIGDALNKIVLEAVKDTRYR